MTNRERAIQLVSNYEKELMPGTMDELIGAITAELNKAEARGIAKHAIR